MNTKNDHLLEIRRLPFRFPVHLLKLQNSPIDLHQYFYNYPKDIGLVREVEFYSTTSVHSDFTTSLIEPMS